MPADNDNPNYALLLEEIDKIKQENASIKEQLKQVTEFNRQLLNRSMPENKSHDNDDIKAAKEKLEKFLED